MSRPWKTYAFFAAFLLLSPFLSVRTSQAAEDWRTLVWSDDLSEPLFNVKLHGVPTELRPNSAEPASYEAAVISVFIEEATFESPVSTDTVVSEDIDIPPEITEQSAVSAIDELMQGLRPTDATTQGIPMKQNVRANELMTIKLHSVPRELRGTLVSIPKTDEPAPQKSVVLQDVSPEPVKDMSLIVSGDTLIVKTPNQLPADDTSPPIPNTNVSQSLGVTFDSDNIMMWPVDGAVSSGFGRRGKHHMHKGLDIPMPKGSPIAAAQDGVVLETSTSNKGKFRGYGNSVLIDHGGGIVTLYAHCLSLSVKKGQTVKQGDTIGLVGNSGRSTTYHVHFEIRKNGTPVDPLPYLAAK